MSNRPNSRSMGGIHTPIQRSGSKLEVLPPEVQTIMYSEVDPHQTHSAGSDGRGSRTEEKSGSKTPSCQRSSSEGRLTPNQGDTVIRKQVVLPTVKRDYERHGTPKDETAVTTTTGYVTDSKNNNDVTNLSGVIDKNDNWLDGVQGAVGGRQRSEVEAEMETLIDKWKINESSKFKERQSKTQKDVLDDHSKDHTPVVSNSSEDVYYYLSHTPSIQPSVESLPSSTPSIQPSVESLPSSTVSEGSIQVTPSGDDVRVNEDSSSSEEEDEEKAPFELIGEFLESVMDEDYEAAEKLCKMILMYEPDNKECKQFQPLIEEMLKREREEQLWGSGDDSDDEDDDDDSNDDDSDDDSNDDEDSDEETESSEEESSDESSSEDEQGEGQR